MIKPFDFLQDYRGSVVLNGKKLSPEECLQIEELGGEDMVLELTPSSAEEVKPYRVLVKEWMTEKFNHLDYHDRWNNKVGMPCSEMTGTIIMETPGMYRMRLNSKDGRTWEGYVSKSAILEMVQV